MATATEAEIPSEIRPKVKRKATFRAKKALDLMVANGGTTSAALRAAGYSEAIARNPKKVTESESFRELVASLGLTDSFLTKALVADIKAKPRNRKQELELGFKVLGRLREREDGPNGLTLNLNFFNEDQLRKVAGRTVDGDSTGTQESH